MSISGAINIQMVSDNTGHLAAIKMGTLLRPRSSLIPAPLGPVAHCINCPFDLEFQINCFALRSSRVEDPAKDSNLTTQANRHFGDA